MDITRPHYWNVSSPWFMYVLLAIHAGILSYGLYLQWRRWRSVNRIVRRDELTRRLRQALVEAVGQSRLRRERVAGFAHLSLSWGFVLLGVGTVVALLDADLGIPIMRGTFYLWFQSLTLDIAGAAAAGGLVVMLWRRYGTKAPRLREPGDREHALFDALLPASLLIVLLTGFVLEGIRITVTQDPWGQWSPVGYFTGLALRHVSTNEQSLMATHAALWWFHLAAALGFLALIPFSKLGHIVLAPLNIFAAPLSGTPRDLTLKLIDFEGATKIGVSAVTDLSLKQALDLETCTECGRCQDMCPAYATGQPLSPKAIILDLRNHVHGRPQSPPVNLPLDAARPLVTDDLPPMIAAVSPEALWSCVTCGACVEACPVFIEHVPTIVDMRRFLVMEMADYPARLQQTMANLDSRGTPYRGTTGSRTAWANGLDVPRISARGSAEYLYWVGCTSAFDERGQRVARSTATVLKRAGVDFAILGDEESCTGDLARRVGDELQFTTCGQRNIATLAKYKFDAVITGCPHCFNSLKNEYPQLGGEYKVLHHSELLRELIASGRLQMRDVDEHVTFHDPCYLGRYNGQYDAPRDVLQMIPGLRATEMQRNRNNSFCCGAGGGHAFTEEVYGARISHARADQALATGARVVATACPFCAPMLEDGLNVRNPNGGTEVLDIAELVERATRPLPSPSARVS